MSFEDEQQEWAGKYRRRSRAAMDDDDDNHDHRRDDRRSKFSGRTFRDSDSDEPDLSPDGNSIPDRSFRR